jgi:hypothetical protein
MVNSFAPWVGKTVTIRLKTGNLRGIIVAESVALVVWGRMGHKPVAHAT